MKRPMVFQVLFVTMGLALALGWSRPCQAQAEGSDCADPLLALSRRILSNRDLPLVLERAHTILQEGLNAGSGYAEVWIRDLNTFIELALDISDRQAIRQALLVFFHFQGADGNIIDGYVPAPKAQGGYKYIRSDTMPQFRGHKNTVETDQESSLVQAVYKYVNKTGDRKLLAEEVRGKTVRMRLALALDFLLQHRLSEGHGLIWGATTADWGDVQPEHRWGVELDENSHLAIDVYDNAMFIIAINNYIQLLEGDPAAVQRWQDRATRLRIKVRKHLWDPLRHKFRPHIYLGDSPFPRDFAEERIYYHGGTAVAIEAGLLSREEITLVLGDMINNKRFSGAASIGLTVYPPYPLGYFKNPSMKPFSYQNGGDWTWFGGRMIQQLTAHNFVEEAYQELLPMVERVRKNRGFFEWYTIGNEPKGSGTFRGSAGVLGRAIEMLLAWAQEQQNAGH